MCNQGSRLHVNTYNQVAGNRCDNIGASNVPEITLRAITLDLDNLEVTTLKENKIRKG
jgi:hypothetical protein